MESEQKKKNAREFESLRTRIICLSTPYDNNDELKTILEDMIHWMNKITSYLEIKIPLTTKVESPFTTEVEEELANVDYRLQELTTEICYLTDLPPLISKLESRMVVVEKESDIMKQKLIKRKHKKRRRNNRVNKSI